VYVTGDLALSSVHLELRDVEDLLAEGGIAVSYETVRRWVNHFGANIAADLRKRRPRPDTIWHLDEVYPKNRWPNGLFVARPYPRTRVRSRRVGPGNFKSQRRKNPSAKLHFALL
jgi:hypothetical protein